MQEGGLPRSAGERGPAVAIGQGVALRTGALLRAHAVRRCLLVTAEDRHDAAGILRGALAAHGITIDSFAHASRHPSTALAAEIVQWASGRGCEAVLGLGGDHDLALAQAAALVLAHGGAPADYAGMGRVPAPVLPIVAVPTVAGSMIDPACVLASAARERIAIVDERLAPTLVVVDSELQRGTPPGETRDAGLAALCRALAHPEHAGASAAIELIGRALPRLHAQPRDRAACAELSWAALRVSTLPRASDPLAALAHALSARTGAGMGACMAAVLPAWLGQRPRELDGLELGSPTIDEGELDTLAELAQHLDASMRHEPSTRARLRALLASATTE